MSDGPDHTESSNSARPHFSDSSRDTDFDPDPRPNTRSQGACVEVYLGSDHDVHIDGKWYSPTQAAKLLGWPKKVQHVLPLEYDDLDEELEGEACGGSVQHLQSSPFDLYYPPDDVGPYQAQSAETLCVPRDGAEREVRGDDTSISRSLAQRQESGRARSERAEPDTLQITHSGAVRQLFTDKKAQEGTSSSVHQQGGASFLQKKTDLQGQDLPLQLSTGTPNRPRLDTTFPPTPGTPAHLNPIMPNDEVDGARARMPNLRLPTFGGKSDEFVDTYFDQIESLAKIYNWGEEQQLAMTLHGLTSAAADWTKTLPATDRDTYEHLKTRLKKIYADHRAPWQKCCDLLNFKQQKSQSVLEFAGMLRQQQARCGVSNEVLLAAYIEGINRDISRQIAVINPSTFEEAVNLASRLESIEKPKRSLASMETRSQEPSQPGGGSHQAAPSQQQPSDVQQLAGALLAAMSLGQGNNGPSERQPRQWPERPPQPRQGNKSAFYNRPGPSPASGGRIGNYQSRPNPQWQGGQPRRSESGSPWCSIHMIYGHSTDACFWLKDQLKNNRPSTYHRAQAKYGDSQNPRDSKNGKGGPTQQ